MRCRISRRGQRDLDDIWRHYALTSGSEDVANRVDGDLHSAIKKLGLTPRVGHRRADVADETLLFKSVYSILIAYRIEKSEVVVVRVIHGARDLRKIFKRKRK
jgi:plasmid stabilization system protein ParE